MVLNIEEGASRGGPVVTSFLTGGVPLLSTFYFQYRYNDHHVLQVMAMPGFPTAGQIELGLQDKNSDDDYTYNVRHHIVPRNGIKVFSRGLDIASGRGEAVIKITPPAADEIFVLSGFQLAYHGTDHHLDEAGIEFHSGDTVTVRFNDKNDDDTFKFRLNYCYVPRARFTALGTARGQNVEGGDGRNIPAGDAVIRGFNFNFRSKDHHIRDIGARTEGGRAEVFFEDKNGDDNFDWSLAWAVLA